MNIGKMNVTINIQTPPDPDGDSTRMRKEIDLWPLLSTAQQKQVQAIHDALSTGIGKKYGESTIIESVSFHAESSAERES